MKPYDEIPFTNQLGQVIQPGNRIVVVTSGRGSTVNTREGVYLGCRTYLDWHKKPQIETVVEVQGNRFSYFNKTTGEKCGWNDDNSEGRWHPHFRKTTLWQNMIFKLA